LKASKWGYLLVAFDAVVAMTVALVLTRGVFYVCQEDPLAMRLIVAGAIFLVVGCGLWHVAKQHLPWSVEATDSEVRLQRAWWTWTFRPEDIEMLRLIWHPGYGDPVPELKIQARGSRWSLFPRDRQEVDGFVRGLAESCPRAVLVCPSRKTGTPLKVLFRHALRVLRGERPAGKLLLSVWRDVGLFSAVLVLYLLVRRFIAGEPPPWAVWGIYFALVLVLVVLPVVIVTILGARRRRRRLQDAAQRADGKRDA